MKAAVNIILFGSLAVALHLAVFALRPQDGVAASAGDGGLELVAIAAAPDSYADMVEQWETPPELSEAPPPDLAAPEAADLAPPLADTSAQSSPEMPQLPQPAANAPDLPQLPQLDDVPPPPQPPKPEPEAQPDPKPEPKPQPEPEPEAKPEPEPEPEPQPRPEPVKKPEPQKAPPKPQPQPVQSVPSAQQTAAGSGGGKQAGERRNAQAATLSKSQSQTLVAQWGATIRTRIDRAKRLPRGAGSGKVTIAVAVAADGSLRGVSLIRSSGKPALDDAAIAAVKRARKFRPAPRGLPDKIFNFRLQIEFR